MLSCRLTPVPLVIALFAGCATSPRSERLLNADVPILSFGSLRGEFSSDQNHSGNTGGLARRAALLASVRDANGDVLHVDLGDFTAPREADGLNVSTDFVWKQMADMNVAATVPGELDLTQFREYVSRIDSGRIPVVCANLRASEGGVERALGERLRVVDVNGVRVGLFGLIGEEQVAAARPPSSIQLRYLPAVETAREVVHELRDRADLVVLLSQLGNTELDSLVTRVPGIDVALSGCRAPWVEGVQRVGGTLVQRTGIRGCYAGELHVVVDPEGAIVQVVSTNTRLGPEVPADPNVQSVIDSLMTTGWEAREAARLEDQVKRNDPSFIWRSTAPDDWMRALSPDQTPRRSLRNRK